MHGRNALLLPIGLFLFGGCTKTIDVESFDSGVYNTNLPAPTIMFSANADGTKTVLSWPVVMGAGGFQMSLYDVHEESNPIAVVTDTIIDGSACELPIAEGESRRHRRPARIAIIKPRRKT